MWRFGNWRYYLTRFSKTNGGLGRLLSTNRERWGGSLRATWVANRWNTSYLRESCSWSIRCRWWWWMMSTAREIPLLIIGIEGIRAWSRITRSRQWRQVAIFPAINRRRFYLRCTRKALTLLSQSCWFGYRWRRGIVFILVIVSPSTTIVHGFCFGPFLRLLPIDIRLVGDGGLWAPENSQL